MRKQIRKRFGWGLAWAKGLPRGCEVTHLLLGKEQGRLEVFVHGPLGGKLLLYPPALLRGLPL